MKLRFIIPLFLGLVFSKIGFAVTYSVSMKDERLYVTFPSNNAPISSTIGSKLKIELENMGFKITINGYSIDNGKNILNFLVTQGTLTSDIACEALRHVVGAGNEVNNKSPGAHIGVAYPGAIITENSAGPYSYHISTDDKYRMPRGTATKSSHQKANYNNTKFTSMVGFVARQDKITKEMIIKNGHTFKGEQGWKSPNNIDLSSFKKYVFPNTQVEFFCLTNGPSLTLLNPNKTGITIKFPTTSLPYEHVINLITDENSGEPLYQVSILFFEEVGQKTEATLEKLFEEGLISF